MSIVKRTRSHCMLFEKHCMRQNLRPNAKLLHVTFDLRTIAYLTLIVGNMPKASEVIAQQERSPHNKLL